MTTSPYELVFPKHLLAHVLPRPGGVEVPPPPFAEDAAERWWARMAAVRDLVNQLLSSEHTDPDIAAAATDESSPVWAAMALHISTKQDKQFSFYRWAHASDKAEQSWADPAVAAVGSVVAAQVGVWWAATRVLAQGTDGHWVQCTTSHQRPLGFVRRDRLFDADRSTKDYQHVDDASVRVYDARLRLRLAASQWAGVAEALEPLAALGDSARLVMSVLVPQRRDWYAAAPRRPELVVSAATVEEMMGFLDRWRAGGVPPVWPTVLDAVGVDLAELAEAAFASDAVDTETLPTDVLASIPTQTAFRVLLKAAEANREAAGLVVAHARRWPRAAAPVLAAAPTNPRSRTLLGMLPVDDLAPDRDEYSAEEWAVIEAHTMAPAGPVADASAVPVLLAALPWDERPVMPVLKLEPPVFAGSEVHWLPGERDEWLTWPTGLAPAPPSDAEIADFLTVTRPGAWRALGWHQENSKTDNEWALFFAQAPLDATTARVHYAKNNYRCVAGLARVILARQEDTELAAQIALAWLTSGAPGEMPFVNQAIVTTMVGQVLGKKLDLRENARAYLRRHPGYVSRCLVPAAFGKRGKAQQAALSVLLMLHDAGHGDAVAEAVATFGDAASQAWVTVVGAGPAVLGLPAKAPVLPGWLAVTALAQVQLSSGAGALPTHAVENLVTMLAISTMDAPYAGLEVVRESCTPESSAAFVWGLFEQWRVAGYPASEGWVMDALGLFGGDDTARRLAPLVRAWPGESSHQRAVKGLDVLLGIGTDVALMQLHSISQKVKFKGIKEQAQARIDALADQLGLTPAQLSDRLVPDFGLGADGTMVLDFCDKTFTVGFDEYLRPTITDEAGKPRKSLPKTMTEPGASSAKVFAALKKDVRAVADLQLRRLEEAMVTQRGWTVEEFTMYLVDHPLVWHLTRRVVWRCDNGFFRVAEDKTFADAGDEPFAPQGTVRVAHQLDLGDQAATWAGLLADYEIAQPFAQLGRETYTADQVTAFHAVTVPSGKVLGLERRGWRRGPAQDAGDQWSIDRPLPGGQVWELGLEPGFYVSDPMMYEEQTLHPADLTGLDPITCSEILRDLHTLHG
ncbi:MAG: DUF4132 domain-containing protein [Micrococcales bacterium]|nr:DUF4132 domain-containing protein [Micrococcales bacterium]